MKNLLPGSLYEDIIYPTELKRDVPLDRHRVLRVYCAEKPPVKFCVDLLQKIGLEIVVQIIQKLLSDNAELAFPSLYQLLIVRYLNY